MATSISATDLKNNLSYYLKLSEQEDIYVTKNGKIISKLTNPYKTRIDLSKSLIGSVPQTITLEESREERRNKI